MSLDVHTPGDVTAGGIIDLPRDRPMKQRRKARLCYQCGKPIWKHERWTHGKHGNPMHRDCANPKEYEP